MAIALTLGLNATAPAGEPRVTLTSPIDVDEIPTLVSDLAHPSYERRAFATRRLCAQGMPARAALRTVAAGENVEAALRAQLVLSALDNLLFAGVSVELAASRARFAWDEPVELAVTLYNKSDFPAKVPFELDPSIRSRNGGDARQVADMLDAAEWLSVTNEAGREISLRVDDIDIAPDMRAVVRDRLDAAPVSVLKPGQRAAVTVRSFNRGWARYPLLDRGRYRIVLDYVPQWEDEALAEASVGRVTSNVVELTVATSAPETVSRRGAEASAELRRDGDRFVVHLTNRRDQPVHVNTNFGVMVPYAQGRWVCELRDVVREVPVVSRPGAGREDFDRAGLIEVPAGGSIELTEIDTDELVQRFAQLGFDSLTGGELYFSYSNLLNRPWQSRQREQDPGLSSIPVVLHEPLPLRVLTGWLTSSRLRDGARPEGDE